MATQKPISTISYNTEAFLKEKLDTWIESHIIQAYQYIYHIGEDGDKDHFHVRVEPNKKLDPMDLSQKLLEFDPRHPLPLGCRPWRPSSEPDWFLYAVHDEEYMKLKYPDDKGEKLPYDWTDIKASAYYDVQIAFIRAKQSLKHSQASITTRIRSGDNPLDLILEGNNVFQVNAIVRAMGSSDYQQALNDLNQLQNEFDQLVHQCKKFGFNVVACNGVVTLQPPPTSAGLLEGGELNVDND